MPCERIDVAVIGGGPAGAAAALTLRRHAPHRRVMLFDAIPRDAVKPGEVLPAPAHALLRRIGVFDAFLAAGFVESRSLVSAWGDGAPDARHSIFSAQGPGWHLDRARFDRLLLDKAAEAGVQVLRDARVRSAVREDGGWRLARDGGDTVAGALVWATGRNWGLARPLGAKLRRHDHLAAYLRFFAGAPGDGRMLVEARPEGWWYSADLPDSRRVVACLTDPDLGNGFRDADAWFGALAATRLIGRSLPEGAREVGAFVKPAGTATVDPAAGEGWVAAGDTLFSADPLSSRGITHALRSGVLAAYAVSDMLEGAGASARTRYAALSAAGLADYRHALAGRYAAAARWATPFWQRRAVRQSADAGSG